MFGVYLPKCKMYRTEDGQYWDEKGFLVDEEYYPQEIQQAEAEYLEIVSNKTKIY